jgi:CheY-like chemotaxis protein
LNENLSVNPPKNIRVLLVEDHEPTRKTLTLLLLRRRYEVVAASSVAEALAHPQNFHVLISDIGLPDGNGYDLMIEMCKRGSIQGIALTGFGMEQDVSRSRKAGFFTHLTKPVKIQSLESALNAVMKLVE